MLIMSKNIKRVIVAFVILSILLTISLLLSAYVFKPVVTLEFCYSYENKFDYLLDEEQRAEEANKERIPYVANIFIVRFSHYEPPVLSRTGYTFAGWYRDIGYTVAWINGRDTVTKDITLYAKWIKNT